MTHPPRAARKQRKLRDIDEGYARLQTVATKKGVVGMALMRIALSKHLVKATDELLMSDEFCEAMQAYLDTRPKRRKAGRQS